jgi:glycerol-3-phosphate acyltransferase PlsY
LEQLPVRTHISAFDLGSPGMQPHAKMTNAAPSPVWLVPALVAAAYALGGISPGWWLVRRKTGIDLRTEGSGATGATNAARILGPRGYISVLILDTVKGMAAVYGARWLATGTPWALLMAPAVVAGHIWPVWLRFRGGRGAATLMGDCLALHWAIVPIAWIPGLFVAMLTRKGFAARAVAFLASLPAGFCLLHDIPSRVSLFLAWALVLLAHRSLLSKNESEN